MRLIILLFVSFFISTTSLAQEFGVLELLRTQTGRFNGVIRLNRSDFADSSQLTEITRYTAPTRSGYAPIDLVLNTDTPSAAAHLLISHRRLNFTAGNEYSFVIIDLTTGAVLKEVDTTEPGNPYRITRAVHYDDADSYIVAQVILGTNGSPDRFVVSRLVEPGADPTFSASNEVYSELLPDGEFPGNGLRYLTRATAYLPSVSQLLYVREYPGNQQGIVAVDLSTGTSTNVVGPISSRDSTLTLFSDRYSNSVYAVLNQNSPATGSRDYTVYRVYPTLELVSAPLPTLLFDAGFVSNDTLYGTLMQPNPNWRPRQPVSQFLYYNLSHELNTGLPSALNPDWCSGLRCREFFTSQFFPIN